MDKCYGIIYKATSKVNGKVYVGQTIKSLDRRKLRHIHDALNNKNNFHFHNAIRKHGIKNFEWKIVAQCCSREELNSAEIQMIKKYSAFEDGYNLNIGGNGNAGFRHTKVARKRISEACRGRKLSEETKEKISKVTKGRNNPFYGKEHSEASIQKISEAGKGKKISEKQKRKQSQAMKGRMSSEDHKRKISVALKGKKKLEKHVEKMAKAHFKRYIVITPKGEKIFVNGLAKFCREYKEEKLNNGHLIEVAKGKYKHHKGYRCEYMEDKVNAI